ncbi:MAG: hypothetical protein QMD85_04655 [Candidatus Aenigmarchaeota archaeon]|nr:hypothetical protein [Candidatus Aenigmarchaeota archaeon]
MDEVADKAAKTRTIPNVFVTRYQGNSLVPNEHPYRWTVGVQVGRSRLTLWRSGETWLRYNPELDGHSHSADYYPAQKAFQIADELSGKGFVVSINRKLYNLHGFV